MGMVGSGDVISERYRLIAPLAAGGMGTVWRAQHLSLDVEVALKLMSATGPDAAVGSKRFKREARAAAKLHSPHIVHVHDYGVHDDQPYLAMELLEGRDLKERLDAGAVSAAESTMIVTGVARALQVAHEAGIIHRDLKPANIFLAEAAGETVAKVLDFGIAKDVSDEGKMSSTTGVGVVGSPAYMSPEQVWGEELTTATDLWSLAVVAFELVTGTNPFDDTTLAKVFDRIIRDDLPRPSDIRDALPVTVDVFFERAFARDPSERFASARELADAFEAALENVVDTGSVVVGDGARVDASAATAHIEPAQAPQRWPAIAVIAVFVASAIIYASQSGTGDRNAAPPGQSPPSTTAAAAAPPKLSASAPASTAVVSARTPEPETTTSASAPKPRPPPIQQPPRLTPSAKPKQRFDPFTGIPIQE